MVRAVTVPMQMAWLPWVIRSVSRQEKAVARGSTGPSGRGVIVSPSKRAAGFSGEEPAKARATSTASSGSTLTQKAPFSITARAMRLSVRRQMSTEGGSAESEEKALTVAPARPETPSVVTTVTVAATCRMAAKKASRSTLRVSEVTGGAPVSGADPLGSPEMWRGKGNPVPGP
ncbi:hypothetical protein RV134_350287 [Roseovarius sp. EC-HK134]|nr:hypothetical protein RV134_350287 [Roseovarius sp. EC-HK134]